MSLVAYEYSSSDEESDQGEVETLEQPVVPVEKVAKQNGTLFSEPNTSVPDNPLEDDEPAPCLPLPAPKVITNGLHVVEEDDEFLRKKAIPETEPLPPPSYLPAVRANVRNGKVQITIPSLRNFKDDSDAKSKPKPIGADLPKRPTGLLSILPKPKSEVAFPTSAPPLTGSVATAKPTVNRLIPDSVANRPRSIPLKESTVRKALPKKPQTEKSNRYDSEDSDDEVKIDFFSLNSSEKLPEISANEINAMVAQKAAKMAQAAKKFDEPEPMETQPCSGGLQQTMAAVSQDREDLASERALSSLIGGNKAKRTRVDEVNIIDINSSDIVPSKEDFLRRKLQEETGFVPTGHLTGDWSCTSKRKSHITYLASKAQDNAQELEAMWASNRQTRRQTQSKYGF
ncbi:proline-rich protein PRCC [Topomyia yanbarensis]|uniref:proline-rich protein PRCC n=1 Tax=Topomyia yanbarensis TaxID=2498891 RepID=UPI00273AAB1A|nr:proline-rich protein PRCC [Topomyia yanbarensis]